MKHFLKKAGPRIQLRKGTKVGEEECPGFCLTVTSGANPKMLPYHRFLPWSKLLVQELLDFL